MKLISWNCLPPSNKLWVGLTLLLASDSPHVPSWLWWLLIVIFGLELLIFDLPKLIAGEYVEVFQKDKDETRS